jgi:tetratricopeptide (TPR) repeat protein
VTADESGKPLSRITWTGLIRNGLDYLVSEGYVDTSNRRTKRAYEALEDPEVDGVLDAANIISSQMKQYGQFPTWLDSVFGSLSQETRHPDLLDMLKALHERGATLLTTNYDDVLEKYCGLQRVGRSNQDNISRFQHGDLDGVFHIHGSYHDAHEVVLDTTDYYEVKHSDGVQDVLKTFLQYKTILFIGCGSGLEDPNFDALLRWASERHKNIPHRHCLLIRDDDGVKYQPLVRVKYGPRYDDLVVYLKRLLDDKTEMQSPAPSVGLNQQKLQLQEKDFGKDDPDTLDSMNNLAESFRKQGKYAEAEAMYRQTLQLKETVLGKDHLDTLTSMMGGALSLRQRGKYAEAEAMHQQTLQLLEMVLGKRHPDTLMSMMGLASSLRH